MMNIEQILPEYLKYLKIMNRSPHTIRDAKYTLRNFVKYLKQEGVFKIEQLTRDVLLDYQQELAFSLTAKGKPLSIRTQIKRIGTVKGLTCYLRDQDYLVHNPGDGIQLPKEPGRLPRVILNHSEIKKIMNAPDMQTNRGYRDRIILEILYDTAIRRTEITTIKLPDLDLETGFIRITGKGDKDRVVPLSTRVSELTQNYILSVRPSYLAGRDDSSWLILNYNGQKMNAHSVWAMVKRYAKLAGIRKNVSTHTFRHSCATHMLKNGASIRHIQELLGHESLESTQIYTRVTINDLKEVHSKYHPGER